MAAVDQEQVQMPGNPDGLGAAGSDGGVKGLRLPTDRS